MTNTLSGGGLCWNSWYVSIFRHTHGPKPHIQSTLTSPLSPPSMYWLAQLARTCQGSHIPLPLFFTLLSCMSLKYQKAIIRMMLTRSEHIRSAAMLKHLSKARNLSMECHLDYKYTCNNPIIYLQTCHFHQRKWHKPEGFFMPLRSGWYGKMVGDQEREHWPARFHPLKLN